MGQFSLHGPTESARTLYSSMAGVSTCIDVYIVLAACNFNRSTTLSRSVLFSAVCWPCSVKLADQKVSKAELLMWSTHMTAVAVELTEGLCRNNLR